MADSNPEDERRRHLSLILSFEPERLETLLASRRRLLKQAVPAPKVGPREAQRMGLENTMLHLEATLFHEDSPAWRNPLNRDDLDAYPLLQQRYDQLCRLAALKDQFAAAAADPDLDSDFLVWFKRLVTAPLQSMKQWRGFTQAYFQDGYYLAEIAAQVSRLQQHHPELFDLQADWFTHILTRPPRAWKTVY